MGDMSSHGHAHPLYTFPRIWDNHLKFQLELEGSKVNEEHDHS